jgi:hypothetical protein
MTLERSNRNWVDTVDMGETEQPAGRGDTADTVDKAVMALPPKRRHSVVSSASHMP